MSKPMSKASKEIAKIMEEIAERDPELMNAFLDHVKEKYGSVTPETLGQEVDNVLIGHMAREGFKDYPEIFKQKREMEKLNGRTRRN
ncbi:MAG: hypothetical protein K8E24_000155 [Methanobacterium paludis]|nr:hypothetical protein [Methanobacterium paludis]